MKFKFTLDVPKAINQRVGIDMQGKVDIEFECSLEELVDINKSYPEQLRALKEFMKEI